MININHLAMSNHKYIRHHDTKYNQITEIRHEYNTNCKRSDILLNCGICTDSSCGKCLLENGCINLRKDGIVVCICYDSYSAVYFIQFIVDSVVYNIYSDRSVEMMDDIYMNIITYLNSIACSYRVDDEHNRYGAIKFSNNALRTRLLYAKTASEIQTILKEHEENSCEYPTRMEALRIIADVNAGREKEAAHHFEYEFKGPTGLIGKALLEHGFKCTFSFIMYLSSMNFDTCLYEEIITNKELLLKSKLDAAGLIALNKIADGNPIGPITNICLDIAIQKKLPTLFTHLVCNEYPNVIELWLNEYLDNVDHKDIDDLLHSLNNHQLKLINYSHIVSTQEENIIKKFGKESKIIYFIQSVKKAYCEKKP